MGKIKSAICLTLVTLAIAVLCVLCFVPLPAGGGISYFNPLINWTEKSAGFGGYYFGENQRYNGGSLSVMLYPEGVVSGKEYHDNVEMLPEDEREDYAEKYVEYAGGALYLEKETVCDGSAAATEAFKTSFARRVEILKERFERLHAQDLTVETVDGYSVRVTLPAYMDTAAAAFIYNAYMGDLEVLYGSSLESADKIIPEEGRKEKPIGEYIKGAGTRTIDGTVYVGIYFTKAGNDIISNTTADAQTTAGTLFFTVGGDQVIGLSVSSRITDSDLYISGGYTEDAARLIAAVVDTSVEFASDVELGRMEVGEIYENRAEFGDSALTLLYASFGGLLALSCVYFFVRYRRLGFAHLYGLLSFLLIMIVCIWAIPTVAIGAGTVAALALCCAVFCVSNAIVFDRAGKEFALGKTIASSVKTGYKRSFFGIFDVHVAMGIVGLLTYLIALTELSAFGLVLALGALFSCVSTLLITRFMWYIMMPFAKSAGKFCHFKREEVTDDE